MEALSFEQARACVLAAVPCAEGTETVPLLACAGRILAEDILADRDYPPLPRSVRDGFAVRSADLPGELRVTGEVRAGEMTGRAVREREAVEIMTGAPVPDGADQIVMVEHAERRDGTLATARAPQPGEFIDPQGSHARRGSIVIRRGQRLDYASVAMLATVGKTEVSVFRKPSVAILPTGDEIVDLAEQPEAHQIRNSNSQSLAIQVMRAGGEARSLPIARDNIEHTRALVEEGLGSDLLLLSGGVSAGKYDIVEQVLADLGAEFLFTRVLIQPGQPLVFGRARNKFFFGLPGNPASTMVTFELFARAAIELLGGRNGAPLPMPWTRLSQDFRQRKGLTRFLPGLLSASGDQIEPVRWTGSGDVPALARANAFLVTDPDRETWKAGELIRVLPK